MKQPPAPEQASLDSLVGRLADQFIERLERGEQPDVEDYARSHPEIADVLRQVLSALQCLRTPAGEASADPPADAPPALSGCLGDFRILREVGRGGMGLVYEAEQISLSRRVALKVLPFAATLNPKHLQRFQNEARAAAYLHHGNIVPVFGVGCERGVHFYAMQFIDGQTLAALIHDLRVRARLETEEPEAGRLAETVTYAVGASTAGSPPTPTVRPGNRLSTAHSHQDAAYFRSVVNLGRQAALALEYAHQMGIVHRDVKPANLMIDGHGNLWVTDFGLAQVQTDAGLTMTGDLVGTIRYMSPEQALAQRVPVDHRTDIYSLGATLYELLTLECAFNGKSRQEVLRQVAFEEPRPPGRLNRSIPAELETIVLKAMAKNPAERYASAGELADDLERYLEDKPIRARRPTLPQRALKWSRRHRPIVWSASVSAALLLLMAVLGLAASNAQIREEQQQTQEAFLKEQQAKEELIKALEREQQLSAFQRVALAERELAVNNIGRAEEHLHECPENLRGLEWQLLKGLHNGPQVLRGSGDFLIDVAVSPDGRYLASAGVGRLLLGELILWDGANGRKLDTLSGPPGFRGHLGPVVRVAFSPDGKCLASFGIDRAIHLWDVESRRVVRTLRARGVGFPVSLAFRPDGGGLACSSWDQGAQVWDLAGGQEILWYRGHGGIVTSIAYSPDGRRLASGGTDGGVRVWDARTGTDLMQLGGHPSMVAHLAYSPDGRRIASAGVAGLSVWEADTGRNLLAVQGTNSAALRAVFSPDGKRLLAGCMDQTVKIWDLETSRETLVLRGHDDLVTSVALSGDGRRLASASFDGTVRLWYPPPAAQAGPTPRVLRGHTGHVVALAFSPDHRRLASGGLDGSVRVWDVTTGGVLHQLEGHTQVVTGLSFSADGNRLTSVSLDGTMMHWDADAGQLRRAWPRHLGPVLTGKFTVAFRPDGGRVASVPDDRTVKVWDVSTAEEVWQLTPKRKGGGSLLDLTLAYSADGRLLAGVEPGVIKVWDANSHAELHQFAGPGHLTPGLAFRPDGQQLATANWVGLVSLWDIASGKRVHALRGHTGPAVCVAFSPDGRRLASGGWDNRVLLWDSQAGRHLATLGGHIGYVFALAYSGDGKILATASGHRYGGEVLLWDTASLEKKQAE